LHHWGIGKKPNAKRSIAPHGRPGTAETFCPPVTTEGKERFLLVREKVLGGQGKGEKGLSSVKKTPIKPNLPKGGVAMEKGKPREFPCGQGTSS